MIDFKDYSLMVDLKGIINTSINSGETKTIDYTAPNNFYLTGCDYEASGRNVGDRATFQVIHPASGSILGQFATDIFVRDKASYEFYKANIYAGLVIRVIYKNAGPSTVTFNLNLITHKDKT